jgi:hypothetical protein
MKRWLPLLIGCFLAGAQGPVGAPGGVPDSHRLRADLDYLCSDELQGRVSLSPSADVAAAYIASSFQKSGLAPMGGKPFLEEFPLVGYDPDRSRTHLVLTHAGERTEIAAEEFRAAFWKEVAVHAPVVFAGYGITAPEYGYDDYAGIDVHGKIVLLFDHEPQENDPASVFNGTGHTRYANSRVKVENARRHGAAAVLMVSEPLRKHRGAFEPTPAEAGSLRGSAPRQVIEEESIPLVTLTDRLAEQLLAATGKTPAEIQTAIDRRLKPASQPLPDTSIDLATAPANVHRGMSANVVGLLEGSDPALSRETIVLDAHYDHVGVLGGNVYRGANDNASGTAAVMELARLFAASPRRPRRSLLFIVFGSEEEGLLGSYYYVEHPLRPLGTTRAVLNLDMIARDEAHIPQSQGVVEIPADTSNQINLAGTFYSPDLREAIVAQNGATGLDISTKFDRDHDLNVLFRCDHFPFLASGVPAVWIFGGFHPGYHEPSDTVDRLDFPKYEKVIRLTYLTARSLADADKPPRFRP